MEQYNFNPKADKFKVKKHFETLEAGLQYYKNRQNSSKVKEITDEMEQMKKVYSYLK